MQRISWLAEELLASQDGLCSMELVSCILKKEEVSSAETWANIYRQAGVTSECARPLHYENVARNSYKLYSRYRPTFLLGELSTSVTR
jgi:hypothetical protein